MFDTLDIGASALTAQRVRMDTIAGNVANINTMRRAGKGSGPYQRRIAMFASGQAADHSKPGVRVSEIGVDTSEGRKEYKPGHPDAGPDGYVRYPNIDLAVEVVNMMEASRAYEANVTTMEVTKAMMNSSLRLIA
jgi:flagellar basal-body rod protein FlgC